jgi:4-hydroxybutyrate CoA-transferase
VERGTRAATSMTGAWSTRSVTPDEVVARIKSGDRVARDDLTDVTLYHLHTEGHCVFAGPAQRGRFRSVSLFVGPGLRAAVAEGRADFMPVFLSEIPDLFLSRQIPLDVALVQLSPPNRHGQCTLGTSVDAALAAIASAPVVLAEINVRMPRTLGNSVVPLSRIAAFTHTDRPLVEHLPAVATPVEARIGELVAELIDDGSCLQLGIGAIPDAVLARLGR